MNEPTTLLEAVRYFSDPDMSLEFMATLRWPDGVTCPNCGSDDVRFLSTRDCGSARAKHPKRQFSIKVGTIFEDSPLGLDKWLPAVWMIANDKNGVSSAELARSLRRHSEDRLVHAPPHPARHAGRQFPPHGRRGRGRRNLHRRQGPQSCTRARALASSRAARAEPLARPPSWDSWSATGRTDTAWSRPR